MESAHLVKVFAILEATAGRPEGMALVDLAALVGLPKSTAHRLLQTLCTLGYIANCGQGIYRQTGMIKRLAVGQDDPYWISISKAPMKRLQELTQETVNLGCLRFEKVFYLHVLESTKGLQRAVVPQMSDPCFSTALGRAIVAFLPEERQDFLLRHATIEKRTPKTVVDPVRLKKILKQVASEGMAYEEEQTDLGVACLAAPIFDNEGVVAAISIATSQSRLGVQSVSKWKQAIQAAAEAISQRIQNTIS